MPSRSTNLLAGQQPVSRAGSAATKPAQLPLLKTKSTPALPPLPGQESDNDDEEPAGQIAKSLKRKSPSGEPSASAAKESRRQKKARKLASKAGEPNGAGQDGGERKEEPLNEDIGRMDGQLMADYLARQTKRFEPDISAAEFEERRVAGSTFVDTSGFSERRTLASLPAFVEQYSERSQAQLLEAPKRNGAPHTIVVAAAGIRAADLTRALRVFQTKDAMVAKLFAKHIKLKEAVEMAQKSRMHIGVGTPQRLFDLIEQGAVSVEQLERVVIDASALNAKQRGILDMAETERPLSRLLSRADVQMRFAQGTTKIAVY